MATDEVPGLPKGAKEIPTGGRFVKWEKVGDTVQGVALRMELSRKYAGENYVLVLRTDEGERIAVSAPLRLKQAIEDHDLVGHRLVIIFVSETESKAGKVKEFKLGELPRLKSNEEEGDLPY